MTRLYLRGMLQVDYPQGLRSQLRENLLMGVVDKEAAVEFRMRRFAVEANILPILKPAAIKQQWERITDGMHQCAAWHAYIEKFTDSAGPTSLPSKVLLDLYEALEKSGVLDKIRARDQNLEAELTS